jgi:hypothetical protein
MSICSECERLRQERDRLELLHAMALKAITDNPEGDTEQHLLLRAMGREAKIELDVAQIKLELHRGTHAAV